MIRFRSACPGPSHHRAAAHRRSPRSASSRRVRPSGRPTTTRSRERARRPHRRRGSSPGGHPPGRGRRRASSGSTTSPRRYGFWNGLTSMASPEAWAEKRVRRARPGTRTRRCCCRRRWAGPTRSASVTSRISSIGNRLSKSRREHRHHVSGDVPVDHQLPGVGAAVEAVERDRDVAQLRQRDRATVVQVATHPGPDGRRDRRDRGLRTPPGGGDSRSAVGSPRSRSAAGVGCTSPKPSGRSGSGLAPTRHPPAGPVVAGPPPGGRVAVPPGDFFFFYQPGGCGYPRAPVPLLEVASPTGGPEPGGPGWRLPAQPVSTAEAVATAQTSSTTVHLRHRPAPHHYRRVTAGRRPWGGSGWRRRRTRPG